LQQHHAPRLPILGEPRPASAECRASDQHDSESAGGDAATKEPQTLLQRWQRFRFGGIFRLGHDRDSFVIGVDIWTLTGAAQSTLNQVVQPELSYAA
jgi:hypothetical protein